MSFIKKLTVVACSIFIVSLQLVGAQESADTSTPSIYSTEVSEVSFSEVAPHTYKVDFTLQNNGAPQTGVKYRVALRPLEDDNGIASGTPFHITYPEVVSLGTGDTIKRTVDFVAPTHLEGEYLVAVELGGDHGIKFAVSLANDIVSFTPEARSFGLVEEQCALYVVGEETAYELTQGVDVAATEQLELRCAAFNTTGSPIELTPKFTTFERNEWGSTLDVDYGEISTVLLPSEEVATVTVPLPLILIPQAYDLAVSLSSNNEVLPTVVAHYVIQGESATIHNVTLDKESYQTGDTAKVALAWTGAADSFRDSRGEANAVTQTLSAAVRFESLSGQVCSEVVSVLLGDEDRGLTEIPVPVTADCPVVVAFVSIVNADGKTLVEKVYNFASINPATEEVVKSAISETTGINKLVVGGITLIAFLLLLLLILRLKKPTREVIAMVILMSAIGLSSAVVYAGTRNSSMYMWWVEGQSWTKHTATISFAGPVNKVYSGNTPISFSGDMIATSCANTVNSSKFNLYINGPTRKSSDHYGDNFAKSHWAKDLANGNYTGTITWTDTRCLRYVAHTTPPPNVNDGNQCTANPAVSESFPFTVDNPPTGSVSAGGCTIASGASTCTTVVNWSIVNPNYPASTNLRNLTHSYVYSWAASGNAWQTLWYGTQTLAARDNSTNLATVNVTASCVAGTVWAGGICSPSPIINFSTAPALIGPGATSTLSWTVSGATSCTASSDNGNLWSGPKSNVSGSNVVTPGSTTVYTLTCFGPGGSSSRNATVTLPTGSITAGACTIAPEASSCLAPVSWTANNFLGTASAYEVSTPGTAITSTPGTLAVSPANRTVRLDDLGSDFEITTTANPTCSVGGIWVPSLSRCAALPTITIDATPDVIRSGQTAELGITVDSPYDLNCTLAGGITGTIEHRPTAPGGTPNQSYSAITNTLTAAQIVRITCVATIAADLSNFAETRVNVVPVVQEL